MKYYKTTQIIFAGLFLLVSLLSSCTKDFEELNTNPNSPVDVPAINIFTNTQVNAVGRQLGGWMQHTYLGPWSQQWCKVQYIDEDRYMPRDMSGEFQAPYTSELKNLTIVIDKAYFPKHSKTSKIMYDLAEEGVIEVNSSAEGNRSGIDSDGGVDKFVKSNSVTAGLNHIQNLLASADKLEMLLDSVTGMNRDRSGVAMASSTATANQSNLQASRDMTYELFYYANIYAEKVLSMLLEKTKINHEWLNTESGNFILSDNEYKFLRITSDISNDSYGALLDDGKRDMEIMDQMLPVFLQEVNARKLRSYDVIRFMRSAGLTDGLLALEEAYKVISDVENKAKEQEIQSREKSEELARKDAKNQFEDMQRHDLEKIITKGKMDENKEITKARMNAGIIDKQIMADLMKQRQDIDGKLQQIAEQGQLDMQQMQEQGMQDSMNSGAEE